MIPCSRLPLLFVLAAPLSLPAAVLFVGPDSNAGTAVSPGSAALIFKVTSPIRITALSVFAEGGALAGSVSVQVRDFSNTLMGSATITSSSPIQSSVWAIETLGSPITLAAGTYSLSGFGTFTFDFGAGTHATYNGGGAVSAYDNYYPTGSPTQDTIIGGGSADFPTAGAGWTALGDPKMRAVNFEFTAVPEPSAGLLVAGAGLLGFGLWRRRAAKRVA